MAQSVHIKQWLIQKMTENVRKWLYPINDGRGEPFEVGPVHVDEGIVVDEDEVSVVAAFSTETAKSEDLLQRRIEFANRASESEIKKAMRMSDNKMSQSPFENIKFNRNEKSQQKSIVNFFLVRNDICVKSVTAIQKLLELPSNFFSRMEI
jgi:hypothetical protein